ncbi:helix-turn-helix domain-containing protein [Listeria fleischmannii]|uniref:Prophage ps1 protein 15 n=1 Tax=Listeria fleischmannii FSL S10-1203 TaxID=1265822 RepID=W7DSG1_9LIST|nr:helix-turn-helix transcriptional regulator [Listeria fleischmannii]EUJ64820.1 prophage ps1 protein 15 [Listeria fleischmannii FSL S10-1203]
MTTFERIQGLAKTQKISIKDLALKLGFGENTIYRWKHQEPKGTDLAKVANYFNVSTDYLLGRTDVKGPLSEEEEFEVFAKNPDMERWYRNMPDNEEEMERLYEIWKLFKKDENS